MNEPPADDPRGFTTTHWSLVNAAKQREEDQSRARKALEQLCRSYWYPLYAFVRYRGYSSNDAEDLTQAFFTHLVETRGFAAADPDRGRFRSYLLGAMKHFLANQWQRAKAQKRGGGIKILELDALDPETRFALEPAVVDDLDATFDRQWAQQVVDQALTQLRRESEAAGKVKFFDTLKPSLSNEGPPQHEIADQLGMSQGAVKVALHRLRKRFRAILRETVGETVNDPADIDSELKHLVTALRRT